MKYLASPYSHPESSVRDERTRQATEAAAVIMVKQGDIVFSPLTHSVPIDQYIRKQYGMEFGYEVWVQKVDLHILNKCSALYVLLLKGWDSSKGVRMEIDHAVKNGIPIIPLLPIISSKGHVIDVTQVVDSGDLDDFQDAIEGGLG